MSEYCCRFEKPDGYYTCVWFEDEKLDEKLAHSLATRLAKKEGWQVDSVYLVEDQPTGKGK